MVDQDIPMLTAVIYYISKLSVPKWVGRTSARAFNRTLAYVLRTSARISCSPAKAEGLGFGTFGSNILKAVPYRDRRSTRLRIALVRIAHEQKRRICLIEQFA